jgi:outer membrane immunogenic protein
MRRIALALLASTVLAGTASAADLAARRAAAAAAAAPVAYGINWTGFYLGGHVGYGWGGNDWTDSALPGWGVSNDFDGFIGGGQLGFDYQIGNIVVGLQGELSGASLEGKSIDVYGDAFKNEASWIASVTGRVGFTVDRALFYVKGGAAWTDLDSKWDWAGASKTRDGWTIGGGLEYAFAPNWSAFVEYNYYDFGDKTTIVDSYPFKVDTDINVVKVGVNYRFNSAPDPVVRKY